MAAEPAPLPSVRELAGFRLRRAAGGFLLGALVVGPLDYGSTRRLPFAILIGLAAFGGLLWLAGCACARRWRLPPKPVRLGALLIGLVAVAWAAVLTCPPAPAFTLRHYARVAARWPYSVVPRQPALLLAWTGAALPAFFALYDLAGEPSWRRRIAATMVVTGVLVALLGLLQNATHAPGIYWDGSHRLPGVFFGPFFHHTTAGAYLNSVWPLAFALALAWTRTVPSPPRALIWGALLAGVLILAAHAGHVSRFPQVIAGLMLAVLIAWLGSRQLWKRLPGARLVCGLLLGGLLLGIVALGASRLPTIEARWALLTWPDLRGAGVATPPPPESAWPRLMRDDLFIPSDHRGYILGDRGAAYATALAAVADRPWFGWGPGGWMTAAAAHSHDPFIRTFFLMLQFTHEDYLQTAVEWGLIGALGWALLVPGAAIHAVRRLGRRPARDVIGAGAAAALAAVLIQSLIDFPLQIPALQLNALALAALAWSTRVPAVAGVASRFAYEHA